jgi:hypothetical protein
MTTTFKYVVNCEVLGLEESFNDTCLGYAFSRTYEYVITKEKVLCKNLKYFSIKFA